MGLLLLAAVAGAEPDGAIAPASRWTGPHGPASNSRRSGALPVARDVVEAWATELPGESASPPVTWDGRLYLLCKARRGHVLCLFDLATGELEAKTHLRDAPGGAVHAWGRSVFVRSSETVVAAYRKAGSSLVEGWKYDADGPVDFRVLENEVYARIGRSVARLSPGVSEPIWKSHVDAVGPVAVYGEHVFCMTEEPRRNTVKLVALRRDDGGTETTRTIAWTKGAPRTDPALMIAGEQILIGGTSPFATDSGGETHAFVNFSYRGGRPFIGDCNGLSSFGTWPAACRDGVLTMENGREWMWWREKGGFVLAKSAWTPDLFKDKVAPTVLGDVAYFGTWAADIVTGEVLWRLPVGRVRHPPVPADKLFVVVDEKSTLRAYRER